MSKNHRRGAATCAAACCRHNASMNLDLSFFRFPKDERRRTIWAKNSGREDLLGLTAEQCYNYRLCSIHFADVMFWNETRTRLLPLAVPTVFLTALGSVDKLGCYIDEVVMNSCSSEDAGTVVNPVINDSEEITEHVDSCTEEIIEIDEAGSANYLFTFDVTVPILRDADYSSIENESLASELQPESAPTPVCLQKNPKGKYISSAQKKMAYDVYKRNLQTGGNSKSQCVKLTSVEVGFGITTVWKIVREIERDGVVSSPVRKRKRKALYKELDEYQKEKISQIVYTCFENNETLTTAKVYRAITEDESFPPLSRSSVWRILKKFGYIGEHRVMEAVLKQSYCNITREAIELYLSLCEPCQLKKKMPKLYRKSTELVHRPDQSELKKKIPKLESVVRPETKIPKRGLVVQSILSDFMNSWCQVDLIDMQSEADGVYKFIMIYQDHLTKFTILRPLKSKTSGEVAYQLMDIFCIFGAPFILQSVNGREFASQIIQSLKEMWPGLKLVHGKTRHSQSQDIRDMLMAWMSDNKTKTWAEGLRFIQSKKNRSVHAGIKRSPYEAMFGNKQRIGLADTSLMTHTYSEINTEEELEVLLNSTTNHAGSSNSHEDNEKDKGDQHFIDVADEPNSKTNNADVSDDSSEDDVPPPPPVSNKRKRISKPKNQTSVSEDGGSAKKMKTLTSIKKSSTKTSNQSSTITSNQSSTKTSNQCSTITSNPSSTKTSNQSSQKCNFEEVYIKEEPIEETAEEVIRNPIKDEIDENINNSDESRPNEMKKNNPCLKVNEENTVYIKQEYIENEELDRDMNSSNVSENRDMFNGKSAMNIDNLNIKEEPIDPDSSKNELFNVVLHNIKKEEF